MSELINYLHDPASQSSVLLNTLFLERSISSAKKYDLQGSLANLNIASRINIYGEYDQYRNLLRKDYLVGLNIQDDGLLKTRLTDYLANLTAGDIKNTEDQGLGRIYYNLALIADESDNLELVPKLLKMAVYNNPEFASFHGEIINFYFSEGMTDELDREIDYCLKFEGSRLLCEQYIRDSITHNAPRDIGFLRDVVEKHYSNR